MKNMTAPCKVCGELCQIAMTEVRGAGTIECKWCGDFSPVDVPDLLENDSKFLEDIK